MQISEFDYDLPPELIAQEPLERRDASRMLVVQRQDESFADSEFSALPRYLKKGDVLVLNNTRVFPARLIGWRDPSGGRVEVLLVQQLEPLVWEALVRPGHRVRGLDRLSFSENLKAEVIEVREQGGRVLRFESEGSFDSILDQIGKTPLPPYIKRPSGTTWRDRERYQTVYARSRGAVAAPTAGLHFTDAVLAQLRLDGVEILEVTLHVGYGTFEPVRVDEIAEHHVSAEVFEIAAGVALAINEARNAGRRIIAVGTTTTRALESAVGTDGTLQAGSGQTALTITPGFQFRAVDALITNFHLPRSSLLLLVSAFAGRELILEAYRHAVSQLYRFYSYGDCMLIL
jgi:S-adenosylmethionine:tRNA ribosyltransferase-isomerase